VDDFARWERNFLSPTVGDAEFVAQILTPPPGSSYAWGTIAGAYRGLPASEHAGGDAGFRAHYLRFPNQRLAVAIFCNCSEIKPGELARRVADICLAEQFPEPNSGADGIAAWAGRGAGIAPVSPGELEQWTGEFKDSVSGLSCRIERNGACLSLIGTGEKAYELLPVRHGHFRLSGIDAEIVFSDDTLRMIVKYAGQETAACERSICGSDSPAPAPLDDYPGIYRSYELEIDYRIELADGRLSFIRPRFSPESLNRLGGDEYSTSREGFHVRFLRDQQGQVNGLSLTTERVWNAQFLRQA
jgi:hypothetical protein